MSENKEKRENIVEESTMGFFEKYLSIWVALCIAAGVAIGHYLPIVPEILSEFEYAKVSIPVAILIWLMIYPMMLKIDFSSIVDSAKQPKGLAVTMVTNWLIKPFTMYLIAYFFFNIVFKSFFISLFSVTSRELSFIKICSSIILFNEAKISTLFLDK